MCYLPGRYTSLSKRIRFRQLLSKYGIRAEEAAQPERVSSVLAACSIFLKEMDFPSGHALEKLRGLESKAVGLSSGLDLEAL